MKTKEIAPFTDYHELVRSEFRHGMLYRGMKDINYQLVSSIVLVAT
ncbi:MAG: hypothetical protein ACE5JU_21815 [Candidatus Binatia bacterium]